MKIATDVQDLEKYMLQDLKKRLTVIIVTPAYRRYLQQNKDIIAEYKRKWYLS
jgi:hypothetical protein